MNSQPKHGYARFTIALTALAGLFACGGSAGAAGSSPGDASTGASGVSSGKSDGETINLAVKFVAFTKSEKAVLSQDGATSVVEQMNKLYSPCNIQFKMEEYAPVDPAQYGLDYNTSSMDDMDRIRAAFDTDKALVVTDTGAWDHDAMGSANAWTAMPGQTPSGAVLEGPVADNANITAHELGHYLSLDHASDQTNLMNPIIYGNSTRLTETQCKDMRETAVTVRSQALR